MFANNSFRALSRKFIWGYSHNYPAVLISIFTSIALVSCISGKNEEPLFKRTKDGLVEIRDFSHISVNKLTEKTFPRIVELPGKITIPDKDLYTLSARVAGRLESFTISVGDAVQQGSIIAHVWSPDLATAVEELKIAEQQKNESLISLTKQKLNSMGLNPSDVGSKNQMSFPLRSPVSGVVLDRKVSSGASLNLGDIIASIGKMESVQFQGDVVPDQAVQVKPGMKVTFDDHPEVSAVVESVSPVADPNTKLTKIRCRFDKKPPKELPLETLLKGNVVISEAPALVAAARSIVRLSEGEFAFIKVSDNPATFKRVPIEINSRNSLDIAITPKGEIKPGVEIITDGALLVNQVLEGED